MRVIYNLIFLQCQMVNVEKYINKNLWHIIVQYIRDDIIFHAENNNIKLLETLLKIGVDPNIKDKYGWTAMCHSSCYGRTECIKLLFEHGANDDAQIVLNVK